MTVAKCQTYNIFNNAVISGDTSIRYDTATNLINNRALDVYLFHMEFNKGCTSCEANYMIFPISATNPDNTFSPYTCTNNPFNPLTPVTNTSDIPNCLNYGLLDPLLVNGYPTFGNQNPTLLTCKLCTA